MKAKPINRDQCELSGPYECGCGGHIMLDATFLDQVSSTITCPYCERALTIPDYQTGDHE
jgi:hypothetical protein